MSEYTKKLIEVAPFLPLDAISVASKADKDKKTGAIKNVHKWFAPMPTPALRACSSRLNSYSNRSPGTDCSQPSSPAG